MPSQPTESGRRLLATTLSFIIPGAGHWVLGSTVRGAIMLSVFIQALVLMLVFRLPDTYWGWVGCAWILIPLLVWASCSSLRVPSEKASPASRWWLPLVFLMALFAVGLHANWMIRAAGLRSFSVPSSSMQPTIEKNDRVMVDLRAYVHRAPRSRDIVVFTHDGSYTVKRVIAVGGDVISSEDGIVSVNGVQFSEPYAIHQNGSDPPEGMNDFDPIKIPDGELFVMGDNRDVSLDSRNKEFGFVAASDVIGRPIYVTSRVGFRAGMEIH